MFALNLGLDNQVLYKGCEIQEVGGRLCLVTLPEDAMNIVGRNIAEIITTVDDRSQIVLTGPMAVWAYLIVFHSVVHKFAQVWHDDGRNNKIQIAQH